MMSETELKSRNAAVTMRDHPQQEERSPCSWAGFDIPCLRQQAPLQRSLKQTKVRLVTLMPTEADYTCDMGQPCRLSREGLRTGVTDFGAVTGS